MAYDHTKLKKIFERANGRCHLCHKELALRNYGIQGARGAWEVDHSLPKASGGSDHLNNLLPAHISCNRRKQDDSNRKIRSAYGYSKKPLSKTESISRKESNTLAGGTVGLLIGLCFNPLAAIGGALFGAAVAFEADVE
ncbi:MAG TPA: HNH endonuclease signature motif containing protein [bacterium]|nr:HNH endonuclease signature motif containing protein [bacterium]